MLWDLTGQDDGPVRQQAQIITASVRNDPCQGCGWRTVLILRKVEDDILCSMRVFVLLVLGWRSLEMKVCQEEEEEEEMSYFTCLGLKCFLHSFKKLNIIQQNFP